MMTEDENQARIDEFILRNRRNSTIKSIQKRVDGAVKRDSKRVTIPVDELVRLLKYV